LGFIDRPVWLEIAHLMLTKQTTFRKKMEELYRIIKIAAVKKHVNLFLKWRPKTSNAYYLPHSGMSRGFWR